MGIPIDGVRLGHWTDSEAETGCTVIVLPEGTTASGEVRGGAPASRELDLLAPDKTVGSIDGVVLTGGSAFGLAAADGAMRWFEEQGRGVETPGGRVPIVPTLALFDLGVGDPKRRPGPDEGHAAAEATAGDQIVTGRIGAGAGAYVSHWRGLEGRHPGGLAYAERQSGPLTVAALCAVNAFGDVDPRGDGELPDGMAEVLGATTFASRAHTTIGCVITNALLDKAGCLVVAQGAHDGLGRALTPPHTRFDGDAFVTAATGEVEAPVDLVRLLALTAVAEAIRSVA